MPISIFAEKIARHLISYLTKNISKLPERYEYDADNEALVQAAEKSVGQVAALAGAYLSAGFSQGLAYWSGKSPSQSPSGNEWGIAYTEHHGPVGVDRAVKFAKLFGLLEDLGRGDSVVTTLKQQGEGRSSDLFNELGFFLQPNNILNQTLTREDCQHIREFAVTIAEPDYPRSTLVEGLIKVIIDYSNIIDAEIEEEKERLGNSNKPIQGMSIRDSSNSHRTPLSAPEKLWKPEYARLKLIYEWAVRKEKEFPPQRTKDMSSSTSSSVVSRLYLKSKSTQSFTGQGSAQSSVGNMNSAQSSASSSSSARSSVGGSARSAARRSSSPPSPGVQESKDKELQFYFE